jgi:superoxide dismutase, Cu-Zn family
MKLIHSLSLPAGVMLFACAPSEKQNDESTADTTAMNNIPTKPLPKKEAKNKKAMATISPASDSKLTGDATFEDMGDGTVTIELSVSNAAIGTHAVHLHEKGDCSAGDATSAGGHWNPTGENHGRRTDDMSKQFHSGDIGNMEVSSNGQGSLKMSIKGWSVGGTDSTNIIGKAIIIHAGVDDFVSQPSGDAGARVACSVIQEKM